MKRIQRIKYIKIQTILSLDHEKDYKLHLIILRRKSVSIKIQTILSLGHEKDYKLHLIILRRKSVSMC